MNQGMLSKAIAGVLCVGAIGILSACQSRPRAMRDEVNRTEIVIDEAMENRTWDSSTAYYANGNIRAGGTGELIYVRADENDEIAATVGPLIFVANVLLMPVTIFTPNSPFVARTSHGATVPPTYTAMPPLRAETPYDTSTVVTSAGAR
jgi:hypothetical protein